MERKSAMERKSLNGTQSAAGAASKGNPFADLRLRESGRLLPRVHAYRMLDNDLRSIDLSNTREVVSRHTQPIYSLDIDLVECRYLLSCGGDGAIAVYDLSESINSKGFRAAPMHQQREWVSRHEFAVTAVQWYPFDTGMFVSSSTDCTVKVWDTNTLKAELEFKFEEIVNSCGMSPISSTHSLIAAATNDCHMRLCDMKSGAFSHTLIGHKADVWTLAWSPCSEYMLASGSVDQTIRVWDIRRAGCLMVLDQHNDASAFVNQKYLSVTDASKVRHVQSHDGSVTHLAFTPDGRQLLSSGTDKRLRLWDALVGKNKLVNYEAKNAHRINRFAVSTCGQYVFFPNHLSIYMFAINSGRLVKVLNGHFDRVTALVQHPHRTELFSGSDDRSILTWCPPDRRVALEGLEKFVVDDADGEPAEESGAAAGAEDGTVSDRDDWSDDDGNNEFGADEPMPASAVGAGAGAGATAGAGSGVRAAASAAAARSAAGPAWMRMGLDADFDGDAVMAPARPAAESKEIVRDARFALGLEADEELPSGPGFSARAAPGRHSSAKSAAGQTDSGQRAARR